MPHVLSFSPYKPLDMDARAHSNGLHLRDLPLDRLEYFVFEGLRILLCYASWPDRLVAASVSREVCRRLRRGYARAPRRPR